MTTEADIVNRALQTIGTRTTVSAAQLAANSTNEAIQANICLYPFRDELLRMAPWECAFKTANLSYITSQPGTPENTSPATSLWQPGTPPPPWVYEYQYPVDCLKACYIIPAFQTGFSDQVPITTAVTGGAAAWWRGPPVKWDVGVDSFYAVTGAAVTNGGTGYAAGQILQLEQAAQGDPPLGAPAQIRVLTVNGSGVILTAEIVNVIMDESPSVAGSYFFPVTGAQSVAQVYQNGQPITGGTGATFTLTFATVTHDQRVILTNQEYATLAYVKKVTNPNVMDKLFQKAWVNVLGAGMAMALTGDKALANGKIALANDAIAEARKADGNEALIVNDVTPDWIRTRGIIYPTGIDGMVGPNFGFDWGGMWPMY